MPHIVSTLTNSQQITDWSKPGSVVGKMASPAVKGKMSVLIKGTIGAGAFAGIQTPNGAVTKVTEEELEFLKTQKTFQQFVERGHFKIVGKEPVVEKVAADMPKDDGEVKGENGEEITGSAQLSIDDGDFEEGGRAAGAVPGETKII